MDTKHANELRMQRSKRRRTSLLMPRMTFRARSTSCSLMCSRYLKSKNFHWHMSGPHFRDCHLLLDEHGDELFAMTDSIAERVRKVGGTTLRSNGQIAACSVSSTTTLTTSPRPTCWPSCATTTSNWWRICARRTRCATNALTWQAQVCSKPGLMRPNGAYGSCSRPAAEAKPRLACLVVRRVGRRTRKTQCTRASTGRSCLRLEARARGHKV
jgi:Ferritin-like domain